MLKERIQQLISTLESTIYPEKVDIKELKVLKTKEKVSDIANLNTDDWEDFSHNEIWGGHREYYMFAATITIPENFHDQCVVFEVTTGREGNWDATNPQFSIYVNGKLIQGLDVNHREALLTEKAKAGEQFTILLSAFTGDQNFNLKLDSKLKVLDRKTEKYYYDIAVPYGVASLLREESKQYITIITSINESLNLLDFRRIYSREYYDSLEKAQEYITKEFYDKHCGNSESEVWCVGHTHIDVAWLWTLAVTEDKTVRSFSTVLELMKRYPEYKFMSSQPQLYKYVKENAPEAYEEIKQRVAEGRWEVEGGMFVEADCNLASGEALVRQFIHGLRFFKEEFNKDNKILWLPDVFGYSAALPQIIKKCGLKYFMTTKISWNEFNKMPYDTFYWEGIDGTKVLTHFIPTRDYNKGAVEGGFRTEHFTTYNGFLNPSQVKGAWERYSQKHLNDNVLMSFGYGDGGGGPTIEMLENQRRLAKGIPGSPKTVMSTSREFFHKLEKDVSSHKYLPSWVGELYLEYHRGTYTSMARNKKYNRKLEFAYQNAELYGVLDCNLNGNEYPAEEIYNGWEVILRNQFHDILPGSSIKEVYDDSKVEYGEIIKDNKKLVSNSLNNIVKNIKAPKLSLVVFNPNSFAANDIASFECPKGIKNPVVYDGDKKLPTQFNKDGNVIFIAEKVPSKGYKTFYIKDEVTETACLDITADRMENKFFAIEFNEKGQFSKIYDKRSDRNLLKEGECGNVIMTYEDRPHNFDAWDVNNYYVEKSWEVTDVDEIEVVENGAVRGVLKISRNYLDSKITQYIIIYHDIDRIDIKNEMDWKNEQIFVKTLFPVDIHTNEATFDIQYGNVKRPTHFNTSWDFARFEVCAHKWLDVSEDNYGLSVLNDCKYGYNVHNGVIGLSMLKSATDPNPDADKEFHEFSYSLYPHAGDWKEAKTVKEAYLFNNPLVAVIKEESGENLEPEYCGASIQDENVVIEVVKRAEDSEDMIVRVYECYNRRTNTAITFARDIESMVECNLLEENEKEVVFDKNQGFFMIKPYEIKTFQVKLK